MGLKSGIPFRFMSRLVKILKLSKTLLKIGMVVHVTVGCVRVELNLFCLKSSSYQSSTRGGSRTAATSKMERFVTIVKGFQPLTIITKRSILDVAAVLDPPLSTC